jgi:hypothetical protein
MTVDTLSREEQGGLGVPHAKIPWGILMEEADGVGRTYRLRQLRRIPPN